MMKRIVAAGLGTLALLVVGAGAASADRSPRSDAAGLTTQGCDMTHDCHGMTHD